MQLHEYLQSLVGKVYKVLPMFEEGDEDVFSYLRRFTAELQGGLYTFPELEQEENYTSIINNLNYILYCQCTVADCKRQVFDSIALIKKILRKMEGDYGRS